MVGELKRSLASYRLIYFQPDPEDGERVTVAILAYHDHEVEIIYDNKFPKLRCLAPNIEPGIVSFILSDLKRTLSEVDSEIDQRLKSRAPQLVVSEERKLAWPLSNEARLYLIERFLHPKGRAESHDVSALEQRQKISQQRLVELVQQVSVSNGLDLKRDATPQWILGRKVPQIAKVAIAVRKPRVVILLDGVDLNVLTPKGALSKVNKIVHTFWQYGRVGQHPLDGSKLRRVGVVLNGVPRSGAAVADAHDFALD